MEPKIAKLFKNGASQAVRLPAEFRFEGDEVYIAKNHVTGDVVLSSRPNTNAWGDFFQRLHATTNTPDDFMQDRPMNTPPQERHLFDAEPQ